MTEKTVNAPTKPARSPVERAVVWGVIGLGLVVVGFEAKAHFAADSARKALQVKLDAVEAGEADSGVTQKDVQTAVSGREPVSSEKLNAGTTSMMADRLDIYDFKGLVRSRQLYVYYGIASKNQDAEVMDVRTSPAETLEAAMAKVPALQESATTTDAPATGAAGAPPAGMPGAGGPPGGGPGAGGGRRRRGGAGGDAAGAAPAGAGRPATDDTPKTDAGAEKKDETKAAVTTEEKKTEETKKEEPK